MSRLVLCEKRSQSCAYARTLSDVLPAPICDPALTVIWAQRLDQSVKPAQRGMSSFPLVTPDKACPECEKGTLVRKQARKGPGKGHYFLACNQYPVCRYREPCN